MGTPTTFQIDRGLTLLGIPDHYAILGLSLTTNAGQIRKKFLQLAKVLHPDVFGRTDAEKELATKYFSKMVSPAYQILNSDRQRGEYLATLRMVAKDAKQKGTVPPLTAELAKKLYQMPHEITYNQYIDQIAPQQYQSLNDILRYTADLSELNLAYVMTQNQLTFTTGSSSVSATIGQATPDAPSPSVAAANASSNTSANNAASAPPRPAVSPAQRNLNMAELFVGKKQWADALKELTAAEKLDPNNAKIHTLKGTVQMNQNVPALAKASFQKALKLDPQDAVAQKYLQQLSAAPAPTKPPEKKGGFFGWGGK
ncbi:MAG: DnaJ domain-containing protein [Pseudanabaenaceae cyanobacterium]